MMARLRLYLFYLMIPVSFVWVWALLALIQLGRGEQFDGGLFDESRVASPDGKLELASAMVSKGAAGPTLTVVQVVVAGDPIRPSAATVISGYGMVVEGMRWESIDAAAITLRSRRPEGPSIVTENLDVVVVMDGGDRRVRVVKKLEPW